MAEKYVSVSELRKLLGIPSDGQCTGCQLSTFHGCKDDSIQRACEAIDDAPEADVVEVVRCGECRERTSGRPFCQGRPKDWFCANGARWTK